MTNPQINYFKPQRRIIYHFVSSSLPQLIYILFCTVDAKEAKEYQDIFKSYQEALCARI